jgi:hypothetical protein
MSMGNCGSRGGLRLIVPLSQDVQPLMAGNYGSRGGLRVSIPLKKSPPASDKPQTGEPAGEPSKESDSERQTWKN